MFELAACKSGVAEIRKPLRSANPRGKKYVRYLVDAFSQEHAEALAAEINTVGGFEFVAKYNADVDLINE